MITPNTEIGAITTTTLRALRRHVEEAAAIARAAEACVADGQPTRALTIALDIEPLAVEANQLLQGLAVLTRIAGRAQDEPVP
jgi:hypothetical protein